MRGASRWFAALALAILPAACATAPGKTAPPAYLLLGEVHDNADGHARRLADLTALVDAGWRPALVMEQFDRDRAADLAQAMQSCPDADCVISRAGGARWQWAYYKPLIALALKHQLPLIAGNVSRAEAGQVMRAGMVSVFTPAEQAAFGLPGALSPELLAAQMQAVNEGHCGSAPADMLPGFATAQAARDLWMAEAMLTHAGHGVVLIAGNGHVRPDWGVPYWLRLRGVTDFRVVSYVEQTGPADAAGQGEVRVVKPQPRPDPCASLTPAGGKG